jgi:hypothetical protein
MRRSLVRPSPRTYVTFCSGSIAPPMSIRCALRMRGVEELEEGGAESRVCIRQSGARSRRCRTGKNAGAYVCFRPISDATKTRAWRQQCQPAQDQPEPRPSQT